MKNHHKGHPIHPVVPPAADHETIARRARELWDARGQPSDQDEAIWLEAEHQLHATPPGEPKLPVSF